MDFFYSIACVFCRLAPITLVAPVIFFSHIPFLVRTLLTLSWSVIIAVSMGNELVLPETFNGLYLASEFFLGVVLSLGFHAANAALHMASQLIDVQMGISAGATFDPVNFQTASPVGTLFSLIAVATFFGTNLHYEFLFFFSELFRFAPPASFYLVDSGFFKTLSSVFIFGFLVASPVIIILFLVDLALALISRSMPQAQIYFVALPLKILIGIIVLAMVIKLSGDALHQLLSTAMSSWDHLKKL